MTQSTSSLPKNGKLTRNVIRLQHVVFASLEGFIHSLNQAMNPQINTTYALTQWSEAVDDIQWTCHSGCDSAIQRSMDVM